MKKQIKWTAALSTAAILTALTPVISAPVLAQATGWIQEDGTWVYYDEDGFAVTDTWKKQDGHWYYLDENGQLSFDRQVEEYYVGTDGKRVTSQWVKIANDEKWESDDPDFYWYYYGTDGKATVSKFRTIDNKNYYFDSEGRMTTGLQEIDGATYYFGKSDDGVMKKGWVELESDNHEEVSTWHYFDSSGKMIQNELDKRISGNYYTFKDGKMQTGWYKLPSEETVEGSAAGYQYYDSDGKRASGWRTIEGIPGVSAEDELYKFYFKSGKPYFAQTGIQVFNISSNKYGFNTKGEMQTGLQTVTLEDGSTANFYFGTDGVMKTGKQTIFNEDEGIDQIWFFHTDSDKRGQGYHGIRDNVIYENGLRKQADAGSRYGAVSFDGKNYLVNAAGTIQKASESSKSSSRSDLGAGFRDFKDTNDTIWTVDVNGIIQ